LGSSTLSSYNETLHKKVYPNGFTLIFQQVDHVASVSCGLFLKKGSVDELNSEAGFFHIVEHMLFKGTENRSAKNIVESIERVGGVINAVTSREYTSYYVSVIRDELSLALNILSDMILNPLFNKQDLKLEKNVIIEEIKSYEDNPEDYLYDQYYLNYYGNSPIGKNIAGTKESVTSINQEKLFQFFNKHYLPENMILAISGNTSTKELEPLVEKFFLKGFSKKKKEQINSSKQIEKNILVQKLNKNFDKFLFKRKIEQVNFYIGAEGYARTDQKTPALIIASNILGGGMSSRLFQEVREKLGLCYGIQSFPSSYREEGMTSIFCATSSKNTNRAIQVILKQIELILEKGFSKDELEHAKSNAIGSLAMGYEMTESRMNNIAIQELYYGRFFSLMDRIQIFHKITLEELNFVFQNAYSLNNYHLSAIGDLSHKEFSNIPHSIFNKRISR
jgi:predicted Zn-dependent peptidase